MTVPPGHKGILLARLSAPAVGAGVVLGQNHRSGLAGARRGPDRIGRSWRAGHGSANDDNGRDEHDRVANALDRKPMLHFEPPSDAWTQGPLSKTIEVLAA